MRAHRGLGGLLLLLLLALLLARARASPQRSPSKGGGGGGAVPVPVPVPVPTVNTYPQGPCTPGSKVKYICNDCFCSANGRGYACTRRACGGESGNLRECVPGTTFKSKDGCNDCTCLRNGIPSCTKRDCVNVPNPPRRRECEPGRPFKSADGCNDCTCTPTGVAICTQKACLPKAVKG